MDAAQQLRLLADQLRIVALGGLEHPCEDPHHAVRFRQVLTTSAELFAVPDRRTGEEIERTVFQELTHVAPVTTVDGLVVDDDERLLLIRRADNGLWAMPGGLCDMGESPAAGAVRETREEAGWDVEPISLAGVWDSRRCESTAHLQLSTMVFWCRPVAAVAGGPTTPYEVLDVGWFSRDRLPELVASHRVRIGQAWDAVQSGVAYFDR